MTLASDLGHSVCGQGTSTPGIVHDPLSPLVLGDVATGRFSVLSHDALANRLIVQVVGAEATAVYSFDNLGNILINNVPLDQSANLQALVSQAQAAAQSSALSASASETFATQSQSSANSASQFADNAADDAALSAAYASAPADTALPGGGASAAVSAARAENVAAISRLLTLSDPVVVDEVFQSGFLYTERQVTGGDRVITIPPGIFSSPNNQAAWAAYKLASPTGSVKVQAQAGGSNLTPVRGLGHFRNAYRAPNPGTTSRHSLLVYVNVSQDVVNGELLLIFHASHQGPAGALSINISNDGGLTFSPALAYPANASAVAFPDFAVYRAPLVNYTSRVVTISIDEGVYTHLQACDWWLLEDVPATPPTIIKSTGTNNKSKASTNFANLAAQSLVLSSAAMIIPPAGVQFSSFSSNMTLARKGNTLGEIDVLTSDSNIYANEIYGSAFGVQTVDGPFNVDANFSTATAKCAMCSVAYPPNNTPGGGSVVLRLEGGRDTLTTPQGVMELWFQPDGITVDVRTPKP